MVFKKKYCIFLIFMMVLLLLPQAALAAQTAKVTAGTLNVRSGPSTFYSKIGTLSRGQTVSIQSESNGWATISYNGSTAYVASMYLLKTSESSTASTSSSTTATVTASRLNIRTGMSTAYGIVTVLPKGTQVTVLSINGSYYFISVSGKTGYAPSQYFSLNSNSQSSTSSSSSSSSGSETSSAVATGTVTASTLNVRSGPSTSYSKVGTLRSGQSVSIYSTSNGWAKINYSGTTAYVASMYLRIASSSSTSSNPTTSSSSDSSSSWTATATVTASRLNIRTGMSTAYSVVTVLPRGTQVTVVSTCGSYYYISVSGKTGYAPSQYFSSITSVPTPTPTPTPPSSESAQPTSTPTPTVSLPLNAGTSNKLAGKIIIVDAGHGGSDNGAYYGGIAEKNINLAVAEKLQQYLEDNGATVIMTRESDSFVDIYSRPAYANRELLKIEKARYADAQVDSVTAEITDANNTKTSLTTQIATKTEEKTSKTTLLNNVSDEITLNQEQIDSKNFEVTSKGAQKTIYEGIIAQIDADEEVTIPDVYSGDKAAYREYLASQITQLDSDIEALSSDITLLKADKESLYAQKEELTSAIDTLSTQISEAQTQLAAVQDKLDTELPSKLSVAKAYKDWVDLMISQFNTDATVLTGTNNRKGVIGTVFELNDNMRKVLDIGSKYDDVLFVAIHANATSNGSDSVSGIEVYTTVKGDSAATGYSTYDYNSTDRLKLAQDILTATSDATTIPYRGVFTSSLAVTRETNVPAVLVELGYMTNSSDLSKLSNASYQNAAAVGITNGVLKYFADED